MDFMKPCTLTTDDTLRETTQHGNSSFPLAYYLEDIWKADFHCIDWHWHYELEFLSIMEGSLPCLVGTEQIALSKGYGMFINSGVLHRFEANASVVVPNIVFSPLLLSPKESLIYEKYIQPVLLYAPAFQVFNPQIDWQNQILMLLKEIYILQEAPEKKELQTVQYLLQLWEILYEHMDLSSKALTPQRLDTSQARLQIMMQYIHDHYQEEVTLEEIAASASVSKSSALHIFQSGIQTAPVAYLIQYRLTQAAELLYTTTKPVSTIAVETGFTSAGYFCRKFKSRYHISPNEYRKQRL